MLKRVAIQFALAAALGATIYALRPQPQPVYGIRGADGFRKNLFKGVLPPATEVTK